HSGVSVGSLTCHNMSPVVGHYVFWLKFLVKVKVFGQENDSIYLITNFTTRQKHTIITYLKPESPVLNVVI
ncbi:Hypothetical predicted protein, partial [Mytilus galloprovincialis]